jgi:D-alanine-D-alanine ligase
LVSSSQGMPSDARVAGKRSLTEMLDRDWWAKIFDRIYLITDADIALNEELTRREVDLITELLGLEKEDVVLDLCCGNGRHSLELARRGFRNVVGLDYSAELLQVARERAGSEGLKVRFKQGDARNLPFPSNAFDAVIMMGNSFGYFADPFDDLRVLKEVQRVLRPYGKFLLDVADGEFLRRNFERYSVERLHDGLMVVRERELDAHGNRLVSRELVIDGEQRVVADRVYAVRLYDYPTLRSLLVRAGFTGVFLTSRLSYEPVDKDPGMMRHRLLVLSYAEKGEVREVTAERNGNLVVVLLGDPRLPNRVKPNGLFDDDDLLAVCELKHALLSIKGYRFVFLDDHSKFVEFLSSNRSRIHMVLNLCDDGFLNDPSMEAHVPALLEVLGIRYTGAGPRCLTLCYDKSAVKLLAASMGIPVPWHALIPEGSEEIPASVRYPALVKPNFGDNSWGITDRSVVRSREELRAALRDLRTDWGYRGPVLVEEFVDGIDLTVSIVGNPPNDVVLPVLTEDYSCLPDGLPRILTYAAKWLPESPYGRVRSVPAEIPDGVRSQVVRWSRALFVRLGCRDYARFDWRLGRDGVPRLLEANPNPGWVWDGHLRKACRYHGWSYRRMFLEILAAAERRYAAPSNGQRNGLVATQVR